MKLLLPAVFLFSFLDGFHSFISFNHQRLSNLRLTAVPSKEPQTLRGVSVKRLDDVVRLCMAISILRLQPAAAISEPIPKRPEITDYAFLDIKIANYTEESVGSNRGADGSGRLVIGLYGKDAPQSVSRFLETVDGDGSDTPSFYNTLFSRIVDGNLLEIEKVRGINVVNIAGADQYEYSGNVLANYKPILENNGIHHNRSLRTSF